MFKGVKRVLCGGIDKRCSYAFLLILCGFLLSTKMTTPEMLTSEHTAREIEQKAKKVMGMLKRGIKFTPTQPDVMAILENLKKDR